MARSRRRRMRHLVYFDSRSVMLFAGLALGGAWGAQAQPAAQRPPQAQPHTRPWSAADSGKPAAPQPTFSTGPAAPQSTAGRKPAAPPAAGTRTPAG